MELITISHTESYHDGSIDARVASAKADITIAVEYNPYWVGKRSGGGERCIGISVYRCYGVFRVAEEWGDKSVTGTYEGSPRVITNGYGARGYHKLSTRRIFNSTTCEDAAP